MPRWSIPAHLYINADDEHHAQDLIESMLSFYRGIEISAEHEVVVYPDEEALGAAKFEYEDSGES